ncbi:MAG TPA: cobalamin-binding protein [Dehalococcoidia bacterium]|jgi:iron complex transport system substrate-binding protein
MKIWSLLPSATEILFALELGDQVTGVTHECDFPAEAETKPRVTISHIDSSLSSAEIDEQVTHHFQEGRQLYGIDEERLRADPPDVIVTQDLCPVCAVSPSDFAGHIAASGCSPRIVTLNPNTIEDVLASITQVGEATGREAEAKTLVASLRARLDAVRRATAGRPKRHVLCIEWLNPPMPGGHWVPEMVAIAGGCGGPIEAGQPSWKVPWDEMRAEEAEVIVLMPCGFVTKRAAREGEAMWRLDGWCDLPAVRSGEVYCADGSAHFSRPGPRLVDGTEILARILHPEAWPHPVAPGVVLKLAGDTRFKEWG